MMTETKHSILKKAVAAGTAVILSVTMLTGCADTKSIAAEKKYRQAGIDYMVTGDYEDAITELNKALDEAENGVGDLELDICFYKAEAQYKSGDVSGAMETYTSIIDYNDSAEAHYLRGNLYFATGDFDSGVSDFQAAVEKDSKNYELYIGISQILTRYGMSEDGQAYLETAAQISGSSANDLMQKGRIAWMLGDSETAVDDLNQAVEKGKAEANFYLSEIYTELGQTEDADACFQTYLASGKADSDSLLSLGESSMNTGDYASALAYFEAADEIGGTSSAQRLKRDLVIACEYSGDYEKACELLDQYIQDYPDDYEADDELVFLQTRIEEMQNPTPAERAAAESAEASASSETSPAAN